jgi:hypothetical protein
VIHGTASDIEFTTLEALKLLVLESLGAEQVRHNGFPSDALPTPVL